MPARFFSRTQANNTRSRFPRRLSKVFLSAAVLFFLITSAVHAQERTINDYLTLWGTETGTISSGQLNTFKQRIKNAQANGIVYLGPAEGGYDAQGNLTKIQTVVTLVIDSSKFREWNMVGGTYADLPGTNKTYLYLFNESFVSRIYQLDGAGNPINESVVRVPKCTFLDCEYDNGGTASASTRVQWAREGTPSDRILKFRTGSALASNIFNAYEDGYASEPSNDDPTVSGGLGSCAAGGAAGSFIPGIGTAAGCVIGLVSYLLIDTSGPLLVMGQVANITLPVDVPLEKGKPTYIELWYLGSARKTTADCCFEPAPHEDNNPRIRFFDIDIANGDYDNDEYPYFQIGPTVQFATPITLADASAAADQAQQDIATNSFLRTNNGSVLPACNILNGAFGLGPDGTFLGCIAQLFYYGIYSPIQWFAGLMGKVFDFFLGYSLDDASYRADFVVTAWKVVRDISNILFIIILVWTGLAAVFDIGNISMKKVVPHLIINALIINFSLFATRIVIDLSNVVARVFYNRITICRGECQYDEQGNIQNPSDTTFGYKQVSVSIVSVFDPQVIFSPKTLSINSMPRAIQESNIGDGDTSSLNISQVSEEKLNELRTTNRYAMYFIAVSAIAAAIVFGLAMMFWKTAFFFLGRVIGLYVTMIFAPFAFLTRQNMPLVGGLDKLSWDDWKADLVKYAMLAPIFVFFLYIIYAIATSPFMINIQQEIRGEDGEIIPMILSVAIPMLIVYFFIKQGVEIADRYSGFVGKIVQKQTTKAAGYVAGAGLTVASAGTAFAGTRFGSRLGRVVGNSRLGKWAAKNARNNYAARRISNTLDWTQKSSWDPRKTKVGEVMTKNQLFEQMELRNVGSGAAAASRIGFGEKLFEGGALGIAKRRAEKKKMDDRITGLTYLNKKNQQEVWKLTQDKLIGKDAMRGYLDKTDEAFKQHSDAIKTQTEEIKKLREKIGNQEVELKTSNKLSDKQKEDLRKDLGNNKKQLADKMDSIRESQRVQLKTIREKMNDKKQRETIRTSAEYQASYEDAKKKSDAKFGRVENEKDLANAMRRAYVENLRENSFWMKDGKPRQWIPATGLAGALAGSLTKFGVAADLAVGGIASAVIADTIDRERAAIDESTSSFLKGYEKMKKSATSGNKLWKHKEALKELDKKLKEVLAEANNTGLQPGDPGWRTADQINLEEYDAEVQQSEIKKKMEDLAAEMDLQNEKFKKVADDFRNGRGVTEAQVKAASKMKKQAEDAHNKIKNYWKDRKEAEDGIVKEEEKAS